MISKLQHDVLNMNFKLLEDNKPEVVLPGDLDVTMIPSLSSPLTSANDTNVNYEILKSCTNVIPVQSETDTQPQSSKRRKNKDDDTYEKKKKI